MISVQDHGGEVIADGSGSDEGRVFTEGGKKYFEGDSRTQFVDFILQIGADVRAVQADSATAIAKAWVICCHTDSFSISVASMS